MLDALPGGYFRLTSNDDKWLGDYCLLGTPFNIVISVKSYKVKERLLVSGSGSLLVPTIGWGLMDDPNEFKYERLKNYLYRGFIAIYMPKYTLDKIEKDSKALLNTHKQKFIRPIEDLVKDIKSASKVKKTELSKIVAQKLAKKALEKNITKIFFDRGIYKYHGRVKIFAETLRENGMKF